MSNDTVVVTPSGYKSELFGQNDRDRLLAVQAAIDLIHATCLGGRQLSVEMDNLSKYADQIQAAVKNNSA